jgi:hypothetical protein
MDWADGEGGRPAQLHALGREVARASCQFALKPPTRPDASAAEREVQPVSEREAKHSA